MPPEATAPRPPAASLRVLIVDDEPLARDCVRDALATIPGAVVVGEAPDGEAAIAMIEALEPDLVFLDVQMPGMDGFAVIEAVGVDRMPCVVLVTAFDRYAVRAFDVHAIDYVLKPFDDARFRVAVDRARDRIRGGDGIDRDALRRLLEEVGGVGTATTGYANRLMIREGERLRFVPVADIDYLEADGNNVQLHVGKASWPVRATLRDIEARLDPRRFVRVHRSTIVQVARIREVQPWFGGDYVAILLDGRQLRISRTYRTRILKTIS